LKWSAVPIAALIAMGSISSARPVSAVEYDRKDVTSQVVSIASIEQCQRTSSGHGGDCVSDSRLPAVAKLASAPPVLDAVPKAHHAAGRN
jgi:hypothetical protein